MKVDGLTIRTARRDEATLNFRKDEVILFSLGDHQRHGDPS